MVCPTIWGKMTLARLHVRRTFFSPFWFIASILFNSLGSMNGPFFSDLDITTSYTLAVLLTAAAHNILVGLLVLAGLVTQGWLAPGALRTGQTDRLTTFTTTMWMVAWRHRRATDGRTDALVAVASGLAKLDIAMIEIANLTDGREADLADQADFTGRHTDLGEIAFLGEQLGCPTGGTDKLST